MMYLYTFRELRNRHDDSSVHQLRSSIPWCLGCLNVIVRANVRGDPRSDVLAVRCGLLSWL
jgi:hypothetical protein